MRLLRLFTVTCKGFDNHNTIPKHVLAACKRNKTSFSNLNPCRATPGYIRDRSWFWFMDSGSLNLRLGKTLFVSIVC